MALFQGALAVSPSDWVRNCLAFCLIPSDPVSAKGMFTDLLETGYDPPLLHANLAAASRMVGDIVSAHDHARQGLDLVSGRDGRPLEGYHLWGFEHGRAELIENTNLREYLETILSWS